MGMFNLNIQYGVRRLDDRAMVQVSDTTGLQPTFMGIPISKSILATHTKALRKVWKRKGRPSKVRVRHKEFPSAFMLKGKFIIHPRLLEKLILIQERN